jgi:hypothetical protein
MKHFVLFIAKIIVILLLIAYALEGIYTYVYSKSKNRNKIENIVNSGTKQFDVIMLGSSRANNHFDAQLFVDKGINAYNYGMSGATLEESLLVLKLMMDKKYVIKTIILEVDLNIRAETFSKGTRARFMPYLTTNATVYHYYKAVLPKFDYLYYVPFYRYVENDSELGLREMLFAASNKKSDNILNLGFSPLHGTRVNMAYDLSEFKPHKNRYYEKIKQICKDNEINLISLSTPICSTAKGLDYFDKIKVVYPEVYNYANAVTDDKYFSSCGHLNEEGAQIFTRIVLKDFFGK